MSFKVSGILFIIVVQTIATEKLHAARRADLHVTTHMMDAARCNIAIMATQPAVFVSLGHLRKRRAIRELYRRKRARDRCRISHFPVAISANSQNIFLTSDDLRGELASNLLGSWSNQVTRRATASLAL